MARRRVIDKVNLMKATEELLLERGYEGFHFKALSEKLGTARSTIYEYYSNKDELIIAYMKNLMEKIIGRCMELINLESPIEQLKGLLRVFITYSHIHRLTEMITQLKFAKSTNIQEHIALLDQDHRKLYSIISKMIENAQTEKMVRKDLSTQVIASIFFNSIQIPKFIEIEPEDWSEKLFSIIFDGIKA
jgi:AcrR family transcriptional regulator